MIRRWQSPSRLAVLVALAVATLFAGGCRTDMQDQPKYQPMEGSSFFDDGRASRPQVPGTVARGTVLGDEHLLTGRVGSELTGNFPFEVTREVMERGRREYNVFCSPCHGYTGDGNGMVVQRGFPPARSFHEQRLVDERAGYFFETITNGYGRMMNYATQIPPQDRWAIIAYIRALQLSQSMPAGELTAEQRRAVENGAGRHEAPGEAHGHQEGDS